MEREQLSSHVPSDFHPLHAQSNSGKAALDNIYRVWHVIAENDKNVDKGTLAADQVMQLSMPIMDKVVASVGGDIDAIGNQLAAAEAALKSALATKPEHREYGAELRAILRASKNPATTIIDAARKGDLATVAAAMNAPRLLLGMDESTHEKTLALVEGIVAPEIVALRTSLRKERDLIARAKDRLEQFFVERVRKWTPTNKAIAPLKNFKLNDKGPPA